MSNEQNPPVPTHENGDSKSGDPHPDALTNPLHAGSDEEDPLAAMRDNPDYAELIRELEYIAEQARLLFQPAEEAPSEHVWDKIASQLPSKPDA